MRQNGTQLSSKQRLVLAELMAGAAVTDAAAKTGVARTTVHRWLRDPDFAGAMLRLDTEAMTTLSRRAMARSLRAVDVLGDALAEGQPMSLRLRAASAILERVVALYDVGAILSRLDALEAAARSEAEL